MTPQSTQLLTPEVVAIPSVAAVVAQTATLRAGRESVGTEPVLPTSSDREVLRIGKYEIRRVLGQGGQAQAFLGFDPDLQRLVVVKRYHSARTAEEQEAVLSEGRALAQVRSPYVAQCFGADRHDGVPYLVVEYVAGRTLSEVIRAEPLNAARVIDLTTGIAEGLAAIHDVGLLHRDLKPANIIVGEDGMPRIVDFGLAATLGSAQLSGISGTPAYMAPEQARGESSRLSPRTDVFGVGAILYELLTRRPPYEGDSQQSVWQQAKRGELVPVQRVAANVAPALATVCMRCLSAEPQRRFASARLLRDELKRIAGVPQRGFEFHWKLGRFKFRFALGMTATLVLVAALAVPSMRNSMNERSGGVQTAAAPKIDHAEPHHMMAMSAEASLLAELPPENESPQEGGTAMMRTTVRNTEPLSASDLTPRFEFVATSPIADGIWPLPIETPIEAFVTANRDVFFHVWHQVREERIVQLLPNAGDLDNRLRANETRKLVFSIPAEAKSRTKVRRSVEPPTELHVLLTTRQPALPTLPSGNRYLLLETVNACRQWQTTINRVLAEGDPDEVSHQVFRVELGDARRGD